jgi:TRAP-type transport system periplasmic protein
LPGDLKAVIDANSGLQPAAQAGSIWDEQAAVVTDLVQKRKNTVVELPDDNVKAWQKLVEPIHAAWVKQVTDRGHNGAKLLDSARELVAKHQTA